MHKPDFLIIGGGIIGLSIARRLKHLYADSSVVILEKESACGLHASGRNSGGASCRVLLFARQLKSTIDA